MAIPGDALDEAQATCKRCVIFGSKNEFNIGGMIRTAHNFLVRDIHI
jgi:tRNA G18 (ribose-2'-O)-methylase SpoU